MPPWPHAIHFTDRVCRGFWPKTSVITVSTRIFHEPAGAKRFHWFFPSRSCCHVYTLNFVASRCFKSQSIADINACLTKPFADVGNMAFCVCAHFWVTVWHEHSALANARTLPTCCFTCLSQHPSRRTSQLQQTDLVNMALQMTHVVQAPEW